MLKINNSILLFAMLVCGFLSVHFGKELCWDLANYHYYNPFAFLHHRETLDYWPSSFVHQYFSPTLDLMSYFLINTFSPQTTVFLLGSLHGINFWLLFLIARCFLSSPRLFFPALLLSALGMYGPTALSGIGSFQGDNTISIFILSFVLLYIKQFQFYFKNNSLNYSLIFFAGILLGIGTGLKLTAGIFVLGGFFSCLCMPLPWRIRCKIIFTSGLAVMLGVMISAGYWMDMLWQQHHNPVFPLLNQIFHSPDFPATNWRDPRFLPHGILQTLFFPFYFSWAGQPDTYFRDFRFAFAYVFWVILGISAGWNILRKKNWQIENKIEFWLLLFFLFSYVIWQYYFSILRYAVTLEMLAPLIICLLVMRIFKQTAWRLMILIPIFCLMNILMVPTFMARINSYHSGFFNIQMPSFVQHTPKAYVLIAFPAYALFPDPRPQNYLIPFFPAAWHFIGVPFVNNKSDLSDPSVREHIAQLIEKKSGPFYLLTSSRSIEELQHTAQKFGLRAMGKCENIPNERQIISNTMTLICPVKKTFFPTHRRDMGLLKTPAHRLG